MMREAGMRQGNESCKKAGKTAELYKEKSSLIRKEAVRDINEYHKLLGHPSETITHTTAHAEGVLLKGKF